MQLLAQQLLCAGYFIAFFCFYFDIDFFVTTPAIDARP
jgi:hypothetical protein